MKRPLLVADLFCGAGGSSTGAERAVRRMGRTMTLVCVNHWPIAVETHKRNHPAARHYVEDVTAADPERIVPEGYLDLLMASPECRFHSRARGGRPIHNQNRMNPWAVQRWLTSLDVRCLLVENVQEFVDWGPLDEHGRPNRSKKGLYFEAWVRSLWELGYKVEWRYLNAADYGDATTRTRFFLQARKDGRPIRWPERTHTRDGTPEMFDGPAQWRAAREVIDWSNPGRSLLDDPKYRRRPLSEKTRQRIARGLERFGGPLAPLYIGLLGLDSDGDGEAGGPQPFVMGKQQSPAYRDVDQPVPALTTDGAPMLVQPTARPFVAANRNGNVPRSTSQPVPPITTTPGGGGVFVVQPFLTQYNGRSDAQAVDEPLPTQTTKARFGLAEPVAEPFILNRGGDNDGQRAHDIDRPVPAATTRGAGYLVQPFLVPYRGERDGQAPRAHSVDEPVPAITTENGHALASPILVDVNHAGGGEGEASRSRSVEGPLGSLTTKRGTGLVQPILGVAQSVLERIQSGEIDPRRLVLIDGEPYLLDIRFRMLSNDELAKAMGFTDEEATYEFVGAAGEVTKQIGNAVAVNLAAALVHSALAPYHQR